MDPPWILSCIIYTHHHTSSQQQWQPDESEDCIMLTLQLLTKLFRLEGLIATDYQCQWKRTAFRNIWHGSETNFIFWSPTTRNTQLKLICLTPTQQLVKRIFNKELNRALCFKRPNFLTRRTFKHALQPLLCWIHKNITSQETASLVIII